MLSANVKRLFFATALICGPISGKILAEELPKNIKWLTNDTDAEYSDPKAQKGGVFRDFVLSFPSTFRTVGPDATNGFRNHILDQFLSLIGIHPNTENIIPVLATHWAYGDDQKTMYFKINPKAKWNDGVMVTADDFLFTKEFMLSKNIIDPWYNDFYTKELSDVRKIDNLTIAVVSAMPRPKVNLHFYTSIHPTPKHYYKGTVPKDFVQKYNWEIVPNCGPYQISDVKKGKSIKFKRDKNWWAQDLRYFKNRFNADELVFEVIRDPNVAWEYFKNGKVDTFTATNPIYWYDKAQEGIFQNGYVSKLMFYNDAPRPPLGLYINESHPLLKDQNIRIGLAYSMNVDKVIESVLRKDYERLDQMFTGYGSYTKESIKARPFDLKEATKYFEKAGFKTRGTDGILVNGEKRLSFQVSYSSDLQTPRLVVLKEEAKKAGVELILKLADSASHYKLSQEKKHQIALSAWTTNLRPDYYQLVHSDFAGKPNNNNITETSFKELDSLVDKHRNLMKEEDIIRVGHEIQQQIHDRSMFIPLFNIPYYRKFYWRWLKLPPVPGTKNSDDSFTPQMNGVETGGMFWIDTAEEKKTKDAMLKKQKLPQITIVDQTYQKKNQK